MSKFLLYTCAVAIVLSGCGSDDEKEASTAPVSPPSVPAPSVTQTSPPETTTAKTTTEPPAATTSTRKEPDAGDEEPISTPVMLTGRGGRIRPKLIQVPAFIAMRLTLRSSDQLTYQLDVGGKTIGVDVEKRESSLLLSGLRAGQSYTGKGPNGRVVISATGEPGP